MMKLAIFVCKLAANVNHHGHILINFYILSVEEFNPFSGSDDIWFRTVTFLNFSMKASLGAQRSCLELRYCCFLLKGTLCDQAQPHLRRCSK